MSSIFSHGTIIQTRIVCKKIALQKSIEFDMVSRARLAINKNQKYFSLPDHQLAENQILVFGL